MNARESKTGPPQMLASVGIGHVGLRAANLEKSVQFYRDILGLKAPSTGEGVARIPSGPDLIVLHSEDYASSDFHFGFRVTSPLQVDEWRDWFRRRKIRIYQNVTEEKFRSIKIRDPDGHWIEITCDER